MEENETKNYEGESEMVKVQSGNHNFYLDGYLKSNLDAVKHSVMRNDFDGFLVLSSREGYGKSTLAGQIAVFLDPSFDLSRCVFTSEQFKEACVNADRFQAIVFDETMGYLSSRGAMSKFNKDLIKIMSEMRSKNLFVILCIPNFFELDRYPAIHRTTGLLHIYQRGRFGSYDYRAKKKLYLTGKKFYSYVTPPNFVGRCVKYFVYDKVEYEAKKQRAISEWVENSGMEKGWLKQRDTLIRKCVEDNLLTTKEISQLLGISTMQVGRIVT